MENKMMSHDNIMEQFKFTKADLEANKRGLLSESQQARWVGAGRWSGAVMKTAVPLIIAVIIAIVGFIISAVIGQLAVGGIMTIVFAVLGAVVSRLVMGSGVKKERIQLTVGRVEGVAHLKEMLESDEHDLTRRYKLEIGHHTFQLFRKTQFEALENGAGYIVYYLDDGKKFIVSLEES
jgi:hypothetical protein